VTTVTGWAVALSTLTLEGVIQFRSSVGEVPQFGVSAQATPASGVFRSPATASTGLAVANPYNAPISANFSVLDVNGTTIANTSLTLPPLGHPSLTVSQLFPSLPLTFRGSIVITTDVGNYLVAWSLSADMGVLSSYPPSGLAWPISQYQRIWKAWSKILAATVTLSSSGLFTLGSAPTLVVDYSTGQINSFANPAQNQVHIFMNLAELISDSESELGFVVGHEVGHIIQSQNNRLILNQLNIEYDADLIGMLLSLGAGYDPYAAAGALAKLSMASGNAGLVDQNFDSLLQTVGVDPHGSFNNRLGLLFAEMQLICSLPQAQPSCSQYKGIAR
jgi:Zn-dependent protease with chaperone function